MEIAKDMAVVIEYALRLEDGSYIKGEDGPVSLNFIAGYGELLPSLEHRLMGFVEGEEVDLVIPAKEAFGEYDETKVYSKSFTEFPEGRSFEAGKWVKAENPQTSAQYAYFVKDKTEDAVVLDFNHPLAGKDLHYHIRVLRVRPALMEELEFLRPCDHDEAHGGQVSDTL